MFKLDQVRAIFRIIKCVIFVVTLAFVHTCECRRIHLMKGQTAQLNFPFPCDSTEVTLQQAVRLPFYRSTDEGVLALPQDQSNRFKVHMCIEDGNCSLDLTISNLKTIDQGTYLSTIYVDGQLLNDLTTRIWLRVDTPPDKASCVKVQDRERDWVAIDCTANIGNLAGKIECYQKGQKMPPVNDPVERYSSVTESFLIRKSQPVFCCSSTLNEYKERCECNDAALNLADGDSNNPCPSSSIVTTRPLISIVTGNNQTDSTGVSCTPMNIKERKCNKCVTYSVLFPSGALLISLSLLVCYKNKTKTTSNHKESFAISLKDDEGVATPFIDNQDHQSNKTPGKQCSAVSNV